MKRVFLAVVLVASAILTVGASLHPTENKPAVVKAVAPFRYSPVAKASRQDGRVTVEVNIGASGDVISAKSIDGPPLLEASAVEAARLWMFEQGANDRTARLTFTFTLGKEERDTISFSPPYEVEYKVGPTRISYHGTE